MTKKMRLAIFDLDYTVWRPEMYQLYGAPKLVPIANLKRQNLSPTDLEETKTKVDGHVLVDRGGDLMRVFRGASIALTEINKMREEGGSSDVKAAISSRTDEPSWARICLDHLVIDDGSLLRDCFGDRVQISKQNKARHIEALHRQTGIAYSDMCFFDNEFWNIQDVSNELPDVKSIYTPDGMTVKAWEEAKAHFNL